MVSGWKKIWGRKPQSQCMGLRDSQPCSWMVFWKSRDSSFWTCSACALSPWVSEAFLNVVFMLGTVPHTQWHICWVISSPCFERGKTRQSVARPACLPAQGPAHTLKICFESCGDSLLSLSGELLPSFSLLHFSDPCSVFVFSLGRMMSLGSSL